MDGEEVWKLEGDLDGIGWNWKHRDRQNLSKVTDLLDL